MEETGLGSIRRAVAGNVLELKWPRHVDIDDAHQVTADIAEVPDIEHHRRRKLTLNIEIELLSIRWLPSQGIWSINDRRSQSRVRAGGRSSGIGQVSVEIKSILRRKRWVGILAVLLVMDRVRPVKNSVSATNAGFAIAEGIPGKTKSRCEIFLLSRCERLTPR